VPSPPGMLVPHGGSSCANCMYVAPDVPRCLNHEYARATYDGKKSGDSRFVDGKTGLVVLDPEEFCCNFFDWTPPRSLLKRVRKI